MVSCDGSSADPAPVMYMQVLLVGSFELAMDPVSDKKDASSPNVSKYMLKCRLLTEKEPRLVRCRKQSTCLNKL